MCYPQGTLNNNGISHWNANFGISTTDDHGFLVALAQHLHETYDLSPDCTYSCGMSNGGYMSYSLACQHPDVFKAVGVVAGAMSDYDFDNCNPEEVIPIIHVHGTADGVVDYNNGYLGPWGNEGIPDIIELWTDIMGTTGEDQTTLPNLQIIDFSSVDFFRYFGAPEAPVSPTPCPRTATSWFGRWGNTIDSPAHRELFPIVELSMGNSLRSRRRLAAVKPSWCNGQSTDCACSPIAMCGRKKNLMQGHCLELVECT